MAGAEPPLRATEAGAAAAYPRDAIRNAWRKKLKVGRLFGCLLLGLGFGSAARRAVVWWWAPCAWRGGVTAA